MVPPQLVAKVSPVAPKTHEHDAGKVDHRTPVRPSDGIATVATANTTTTHRHVLIQNAQRQLRWSGEEAAEQWGR